LASRIRAARAHTQDCKGGHKFQSGAPPHTHAAAAAAASLAIRKRVQNGGPATRVGENRRRCGADEIVLARPNAGFAAAAAADQQRQQTGGPAGCGRGASSGRIAVRGMGASEAALARWRRRHRRCRASANEKMRKRTQNCRRRRSWTTTIPREPRRRAREDLPRWFHYARRAHHPTDRPHSAAALFMEQPKAHSHKHNRWLRAKIVRLTFSCAPLVFIRLAFVSAFALRVFVFCNDDNDDENSHLKLATLDSSHHNRRFYTHRHTTATPPPTPPPPN
jgi:hypothetical protein